MGAQDTVLSGGRYDGLVKTMGGPEIPSVGLAAGVERLSMLLADKPKTNSPVVFIPVSEEQEAYTQKLLSQLRAGGISAQLTYSGNMSKRMKKASKLNAQYVVVIGENEVANNEVTLKDLQTAKQKNIPSSQLLSEIKNN